MPLLKDGLPTEDSWRLAESEEDLDQDGPLFVTAELWHSARARLAGRNAPLGLRLKSDQSPADLAEDLAHFKAIALEFPKFTDGRPYSHARILRERLGFRGELRAVGAVLHDQLAFMERCGFDAVELDAPEAAASWTAATREFSAWYQPAGEGGRPIPALRRRLLAAE